MAEAGRPSGDAQGTVGHVVTQRGRDLGPVDRIAVGEQSAAALTDWRVWWQVDFTEHLHPHSLRGCDPPAPHTPAELRDLFDCAPERLRMKWFLQTLKSLVPLWRASMTAGDKSPHEVDLADDMLAAWDWETICGNETGSELSHVHALARQLGDRALPFSGPQSPATIRCMAEAIGSTLYGVQLEIEASFARMSGQFPLAEPWGDPADNVIHLCGAYVGERLHVHLLRGHLLSRWWARWQLARAYEE